MWQCSLQWNSMGIRARGVSDGKQSACNVGDPILIPGLGRSPGEGNGHHSHIFSWRINGHGRLMNGVTKSQAWLSDYRTHTHTHTDLKGAFPVVLVVKNPPANAGGKRDVGSIPGPGRSSGGGHGNPLQYSCLENPMDRGAWWAMPHKVTKSWKRLNHPSMHSLTLKIVQSFWGDWNMHVKRLYIIILTKYEIFPTLNFLYTKIYGNITKKRSR